MKKQNNFFSPKYHQIQSNKKLDETKAKTRRSTEKAKKLRHTHDSLIQSPSKQHFDSHIQLIPFHF